MIRNPFLPGFHPDPSILRVGEDYYVATSTFEWMPGVRHHWSAGIIAQEFDRATGKLLGEPVNIFTGTTAGYTEGPHVYRRDGWYYLLTAEGGTGWEHQVTVARSRDLLGPYHVDPDTPLLTAAPDAALPLQKAGHGSLVSTPDGEWYLAYLTGRPLTERGPCVLGRESALARLAWTADGWPCIEGARPGLDVPAPALPPHPWPAEPDADHFDGDRLGPQWATLRRPASPDWLSLDARPGHLRLHGGRSPSSKSGASLVARRVTAARCEFAASVDADPRTPQQLAGITAFYNTRNWYYAYLTWREGVGRCLELLACDQGRLHRPEHDPVPVPPTGPVRLRAALDLPDLRFSWSLDGSTWQPLGGALDATILSDEHAIETDPRGVFQIWGFTAATYRT